MFSEIEANIFGYQQSKKESLTVSMTKMQKSTKIQYPLMELFQ